MLNNKSFLPNLAVRRPVTIIVTLLAIVVGTLAWRRAAEADKADAAVLMNRGLQALDAGDLAAAGPWFQRTIDEFSSTQAAGEAVYMLGAIALREGKFEEAESRFEETVHAGLESGFITAAAHAGLGLCLEQKQDFAGAAREYSTAGLTFEDNFNAPAHLLAAALCWERAGKLDEAKPLLERIVEKYKDSTEKTRAEQILRRLEFEAK